MSAALKDSNGLVLASKALSTIGHYDALERSVDFEVVTRQGYDPSNLMRELVKQAKHYKQNSVFMAKVLRKDEKYDPLIDRPGIELYFKKSIPMSQMQHVFDALSANKLGYFTVIVDPRRSPEALKGKEPPAIGVRSILAPEFMTDTFKDLDGAGIKKKVLELAKEFHQLAHSIGDKVPEIASGGQYWYRAETYFNNDYDKFLKNKAYKWKGKSIREGVAEAVVAFGGG